MILDGHIPVISDEVDVIFFNLPRFKIPTTGITEIGLVDGLPIHKKLPVTKFNLFASQGHHAF
jgi:hypothetical protein